MACVMGEKANSIHFLDSKSGCIKGVVRLKVFCRKLEVPFGAGGVD